LEKIAPFRWEHLEAVVEIEQHVFLSHDPWSRNAFVRELSSPHSLCVVALESDEVVGYGGGWCVGPEFHLLNLAVNVPNRMKGIGGRLFLSLLRDSAARGCKEALLEVRKGNETAKGLYEKYGFKITGVRRAYYANGEDALVYSSNGRFPPE